MGTMRTPAYASLAWASHFRRRDQSLDTLATLRVTGAFPTQVMEAGPTSRLRPKETRVPVADRVAVPMAAVAAACGCI